MIDMKLLCIACLLLDLSGAEDVKQPSKFPVKKTPHLSVSIKTRISQIITTASGNGMLLEELFDLYQVKMLLTHL